MVYIKRNDERLVYLFTNQQWPFPPSHHHLRQRVNKNMHFLSSFLHFIIIICTAKVIEVQLHPCATWTNQQWFVQSAQHLSLEETTAASKYRISWELIQALIPCMGAYVSHGPLWCLYHHESPELSWPFTVAQTCHLRDCTCGSALSFILCETVLGTSALEVVTK